ncbi:ABC transporter substrate-binding protein [Arthrobacter sp. NPDC058127]|uniref:ABC transporter substrate-binding protein n=1 Tax=Arthrobacter sp. NPDC058127 TaxID=3346351 RepID=UPI0036F0F00A
MKNILPPTAMSRRGFLALTGAVSLTASISACAAGGAGNASAGGGGTIKFWDMPWGNQDYLGAAQGLTQAYKPGDGLPGASYQQVNWDGFNQTFSSAIASNTGPAVSTGGGFQAFQFAKQGAIAYADNLIDSFKKDGTYDDFLPHTLDAMKTSDGYVGIPWNLDVQVLWYRKSILDQIGATPPQSWADVLDVAKKASAKGYVGFGISGGSGNYGPMAVLSLMINNGGGLFNSNGDLDIVNDRNAEAVDFLTELVKQGLVDPGSVSMKDDDLTTLWTNKKVALGFQSPAFNNVVGDEKDVLVTDPLKSHRGEVGGLYYVNNIMMYKNTPSQAGSEAFTSYYIKNMKTLWQKGVMQGLPALKSITEIPEFKANAQNTAVVEKWQPICKTTAAQSSALTAKLATIDGGQAMTDFCQTVLAGKTPSKTILTKLESDIKAAIS